MTPRRGSSAAGGERRRRADVIIVLGARIGPEGVASPALRRRLERGVALFHAGAAPFLLLTGGTVGGGPPEAEAMRKLALAAGVPARRIVLEPTARSTFENALRAADIMRARGWSRALVVTDRHHLPRALLAFRGAGIGARGVPVAGAPPLRLLAELPHEAAGLLWYALRLLVRRARPFAARGR
jgi:uncharacterized SAM-binding protein YcdF (DUF218 family)